MFFYSSWNSEISQIYPQFSLQSINRLERLFCSEIKWDLYISSSAYAKYYFALRSLTEKKDFRRYVSVLTCAIISTFFFYLKQESTFGEFIVFAVSVFLSNLVRQFLTYFTTYDCFILILHPYS